MIQVSENKLREVLDALKLPSLKTQRMLEQRDRAIETLQAMLEQKPSESLPTAATAEANDAIRAMLTKYNFPANPQNAGRAGWEAARLYTPQEPQI